MGRVIRVLLVDDHPVVRGGMRALIETLDGIEVVAEAGDGERAIREAVLTRPDVVMLDLRIPGSDGITVTRELAHRCPGAAVLVLTMFDDPKLVTEALAAGARGYLVKGAEPDELENALRSVAAGATVLDSGLAARVLHPDEPAAKSPFPSLTPREREVLDKISAGLSNGAIADQLAISGKTVGNHISAIFQKLGVTTRAEAIVLARSRGVGE